MGDIAFERHHEEDAEAEERRPGQVLDRNFIDKHTAGFTEFAALKAVSWDEIVEGSGIEREQIRQAAGIMMNSQRTITCGVWV